MKRHLAVILLVLALLADAAWAAPKPAKPGPKPQKRTVLTLLDGAGNARVHYTDVLRASGPMGRAEVLANLVDGLVTMTAMLRTDADLAGQMRLDADPTHLVGSGAVEFPSHGVHIDASYSARRDAEASREQGQWTADAAVPLGGFPLEHVSVSLRSAGTFKRQKGGGEIAVAGGILVPLIPPHDFRLALAQADDAITAEVVLSGPADSSAGRNAARTLADVEKARAGAQRFVTDMGAKLERFELVAADVPEGEKGFRLTMRVGQVRQGLTETLRKGFRALAPRKTIPDPVIDELLGLRIELLRVQSTGRGGRYDVGVAGEISGLDRFVLGYLDFYALAADALAHMGPKPSSADLALTRIAQRQIARLRPVLADMLAADDAIAVRFDTSLDFKEERATMSGGLESYVGMRGIVAAARKHDYPMVVDSSAAISVGTEDDRIHGRFTLDADGPWLASMRDPYADAMEGLEDMRQAGRAVRALDLKQAAFAVRFVEGRMEVDGFASTSGLPDLVAALFENAPGRPTGLEARWVKRSREQASATVDLYLAGVQSPKDLAAALKRLLRAASVQTRPASAAEVAPPASLKPTLELP